MQASKIVCALAITLMTTGAFALPREIVRELKHRVANAKDRAAAQAALAVLEREGVLDDQPISNPVDLLKEIEAKQLRMEALLNHIGRAHGRGRAAAQSIVLNRDTRMLQELQALRAAVHADLGRVGAVPLELMSAIDRCEFRRRVQETSYLDFAVHLDHALQAMNAPDVPR